MLRITLASLRAHALRTLLTGAAVVLGVAFLTGTLIYADTARAGFFDDFSRFGRGVDVAIQPGSGSAHIEESTLVRVRSVAGVDRADGRVVAGLPLVGPGGRVLSNAGRSGFAISIPDAGMSPLRVVAGSLPQTPGGAAVDTRTAGRLALTLGQQLTVLDRNRQPRPLRVDGIVDFGSGPTFNGWSVLVLTAPDLASLAQPAGYESIVVAARPGTDPGALAAQLEAALGPGVSVVTGEQLRRDLAQGSAKYVNGFVSALLAGTLVALVVSCLVVHNIFTIVLARRTRELALLRCVGASRRQVFGLVALEAAALGLAAALTGVLVGVGVAKLIFVGRDVFGDAEPDHALVVTPGSIVAGLAVGVLTALVAGLLPALAASRISPLAALAAAAAGDALPKTAPNQKAGAAAFTLGAGGVLIAGFGVGRGFDGIATVVAGALLAFVGLVVALPLTVATMLQLVGRLPARWWGAPGRLAVANAVRHPRRAAATTTAFMVGVALISLFAVILTTARDEAERELAENFAVDFVLDAVSDGARSDVLPPSLRRDLAQRPEFAQVVWARSEFVWPTTGSREVPVSAIEPTTGDAPAPGVEVLAGSLADLAASTVAVRARYAYEHDIAVGDAFLAWTAEDRPVHAIVIAIYDDAPIGGDVLLPWSDFAAYFGARGDQLLLRDAASVTAADAAAALDEVLTGYPLVSVTTTADRREELTAGLEQRISQFGLLVVISAIIAILGIMDALGLAMLERTRESATLRALGLSRLQLRGLIAVEATLTTVVGSVLGVGFGVAAGWVVAESLITGYGHGVPTVPLGTLAGVVAAAGLAGLLASLLPARRATRASVVDALNDA